VYRGISKSVANPRPLSYKAAKQITEPHHRTRTDITAHIMYRKPKNPPNRQETPRPYPAICCGGCGVASFSSRIGGRPLSTGLTPRLLLLVSYSFLLL
jgi:hypothetical protein